MKRDRQHSFLECFKQKTLVGVGVMVGATGYLCLRAAALQMHLLAQRKTSDGTRLFVTVTT